MIPQLNFKKDNTLLNQTQKQILDRLEFLWSQNPDLRFGQLVANATGRTIYYTVDGIVQPKDIYYCLEDDQLLLDLNRYKP